MAKDMQVSILRHLGRPARVRGGPNSVRCLGGAEARGREVLNGEGGGGSRWSGASGAVVRACQYQATRVAQRDGSVTGDTSITDQHSWPCEHGL